MHPAKAFPTGAPCWFELGTTDQEGAKIFYSELFGWTTVDSPMAPGETYTMFKKGGRDVGGGYKLMPSMLEQGVPPHWMVYFATANADESAAKVDELGGMLMQGPFDVMDYGRMAVCQDPTGAMFSLWQPKTHVGSTAMGQEGTVCWSELVTRDVPRARRFYTDLFGWTTRGSMPYIEFAAGGEDRGGMMAMDDKWEGIPPHWGIYFLVKDCDGAVSRAKELGGVVRVGPFDAPGVGRVAVMADPQGAGFQMITLQIAA